MDLARTGSGARSQREARWSRRRFGLLSRGWAIVLGLALLVSGSLALAAKYVYDDNGRLVVMVNEQSGESARYVYDKVGNLLKIERLAAGQVAVFSFVPARGATGVAVTIQGQGFSTTAGDNVVRFNGVAATVTSATLTELKVTVPAGASTGPLTVTVGTQTVSGPADFVVDEDAQPPQITSVSPLIGVAGTQVTVTGQRLYPAPDLTRVLLGDRIAVPGTSSQTQLTFPVPVRAGSGKITVSTPYGSAQSADEFVVVPAGVTAADVVNGGRLTLDAAARALETTVANQQIALLLEAPGRDLTSLQFAGIASGTVAYSLYGPDNRQLLTGSASASAPSAHLPRLGAGLHLLLLKPSAPMAWNLGWEKNATLTTQAEPLAVATATAYQSKRYVIDVAAGDNLGVGLSDLLTPGSTSSVQAAVYRPDGSQLTYDYCYANNGGCDLNLPSLSISGPYTLVLTPTSDGQRLLSLKATLSADLVLPLSADAPASLSLSRRGQNGRLSFAAQAGQTYAFNVAGQTTVPANRDVYYTVYKPDGSVLQQGNSKAGLTLNLAKLPASGGYQIYVDPYYGETATVQLALVSGETGEVLPGQGSGEFATATPGQNVYFGFSAEQGANLGLGISDLLTPGSTSYATVYVYRPDGTQLAYEYCYAQYNGCDLNLPNLPAGNYSAVVIPPSSGDRTVAFKATLSADLTVALTADTAVPVALDRRGQNARLSFAAQAGQTRAFNVSAQTTAPASRDVYYTVYKPDGTVLQQGNTRAALTLNLPNLPATGNYYVFMDPGQGETAAAQIKLVSGVVGGPDPGGSLGEFETQTPGQNVYFSFPAKQGDQLGLALSDLLTPGTTSGATLYVYRPNGTQLSYEYCYAQNNGCDLNLTIPTDGTYNVTVTPPASGAQTMAFKATLSTDQTATLAINAPLNLDLTKRGENARLRFVAEAGQTFAFNVSGQTTLPANRDVYYYVNKPDGTVLQQGSARTSLTQNLRNLPVAGQYEVFVDPYYGETAKMQAVLLPGETGTVQLGAEPRNFATQVAGQNIYFGFSAEQGANLGLGLSDLLTPGTTSGATMYVYRPNGTQLTYQNCYAQYNGCELNLANLPAGDYTVMVAPPSGAATMSFQAVLSADLNGTVSVDTPVDLVLDRRGQNARIKFAAEAGQTFAFNVAGQTSDPAARDVTYTVYKPDGSSLQTGTARTGLTLNLRNLPASGDYLVFVDPYYGAKTSARLSLVSGQSQTIPPDGDPGSFITQTPGQNAYFTFTAEQGANLGIGLTDFVTPGTTSSATVYVYRPNGTQLTYEYCYAQYAGCDLDLVNLPAGTYSVTVVPPSSGASTMSFNAVISADLVATLAPNAPLSLNLARRGQNGRLNFAGAAGQTVAVNASNILTSPAVRNVYYTVYKPDGSTLAQTYSTTGLSLNLPNLPATGQYTLFVDPDYGNSATSQVELDTGEGLTIGGAPAEYSSAAPWQRAYFTFTVEQGANLGLGLSDVVTPGSTSYVGLYVYRPNGTQLAYEYCYAQYNGCDIDLPNLPAGTYSVVAVPPSGGNGTMSFKTHLTPDLAATLAPNVPLNLNIAQRAQNGRLSFAGTAGQTVAVNVSNIAVAPTVRNVYYTVYKPDGSTLTSTYSTSGLSLNLSNLPATGQYTLFVDADYGMTSTAQVELDTGDGLSVGGAPAEYSSAAPWQRAYFTFTAEQGANLGLGLSDLVTPGSTNNVALYVYRPNGTQLASENCYAQYNGCEIDLPNLPAGTYSIIAVPPSGATGTMSFKTTLSPDVAGTLSANAPLNLNLAQRGQNARLSFAGTAGQTVAVNASNIVTAPGVRNVYYTVYKPDGATLLSSYSTTGLSLNLPNLPTSGQYTLFVDPEYGNTATSQVELDTGDGLSVGGAPAEYSSAAPWQRAYFTFSVEQGANLGLGLSDLVTPGSTNNVALYVYRPNGTQLVYENCYAQYGGCEIDLPNLPAGTYSIIAVPPSGTAGTMSFKTTLSPDVAGSLSPNVPLNLDIAKRGQNARLNFAGTAGQTVAVNVSNIAVAPTVRNVYYTVYKPDGSSLLSSYSTSGLSLNLPNLPATGQYTLFVDADYGMTSTAQVELDTGDGLSVGGAPAEYSSAAPWQRAYFTFTVAQGANLGLGLSDLVTPGSTNNVGLYVYRPNGTQLVYENCYAQYNGCEIDLPNLPAGTYSAIVVPPSGPSGTMSFKTTLSADVAGTLTPNAPLNLDIAQRGQNARLSFAGTAGQTVAVNISNIAVAPTVRNVYYTVYKPDGSSLLSSYSTSGLSLNLANLPVSGQYTLFVDADYGMTSTAQVELDTGDGLSVDGAPAEYSSAASWQRAYYTVAVAQGANLGLGLSDLLTPGSTNNVTLYVYRPNGTQLAYENCYAQYGGCEIDLPNLPAGTYSIIAVPPSGAAGTMSFKTTLSADVAATLAPDAPISLNLGRRGQNGRFAFAGAVGQNLAIKASNLAIAPTVRNVYYTVYKPDGSLLQQSYATNGLAINLASLPVAGQYSLFVDADYGMTSSSRLELSSGAGLSVDGAVVSHTSAAAWDRSYYTVAVAQGASLGLGLSDLVTPGSTSNVALYVYRPNGTLLVSENCYAQYGGCELDLPNLPAGTYSIFAVPPSGGDGTASYKVTLSRDATGTLSLATPFTLALNRAGQNAALNLAATAGQSLTLTVASQTTDPANRDVYYSVYRPGGALFKQTYTRTGTAMTLPNLPDSGNYLVQVDANYGAKVGAQLTVTSP
ncbi:pre-peptidase C-terminal domain-containing protein [Lysobacter enzymogenes]|uniref:pre-peptidase C-terminal domain-containing protein n=1 Tax=Lysobacter enzymogenes TaxID=69 RepID=UPI001A970917|nr:pre-peptidase C-terminal domain-containing protein [Lysobacter enzymogenes]QQP98388.1 pre-peptidase C-terminal domain-containing protein [Lysobacter enzymogenes]